MRNGCSREAETSSSELSFHHSDGLYVAPRYLSPTGPGAVMKQTTTNVLAKLVRHTFHGIAAHNVAEVNGVLSVKQVTQREISKLL
jgi:hypothetical protein